MFYFCDSKFDALITARKYTTLFILLLGVLVSARAQQLPLYTQYINNGFLLNPAMTGYDGYTSLNLTARKDWVGFPGAPLTYSLSGQTRLFQQPHEIVGRRSGSNRLKARTRGRVGVGGYVFNDVTGAVSRTGLNASYAYHIYLNNSQLSFGLSGQFFQFKIGDTLSFANPGDPLIGSGYKRVAYIPDANFGVFWTSRNWFGGFSANQLFQSVVKLGSGDLGNLKMYRHYYVLGGYRFINEHSGFDFEPSFLLKASRQSVPQADLTMKVFYRTDYWAGVSYRTSGSFSTMFGVKTEKFYIGYAIDFALSSIRKYSFGSHEVLLSVKFGSNERRFRWLNRY